MRARATCRRCGRDFFFHQLYTQDRRSADRCPSGATHFGVKALRPLVADVTGPSPGWCGPWTSSPRATPASPSTPTASSTHRRGPRPAHRTGLLTGAKREPGHRTTTRALLAGTGSGALIGASFGLLFSLWLAPDGLSLLVTFAYWTLTGALAGTLVSGLAHARSGGRSDFTSTTTVQPERYELLVDEPVADDATRQLTGPRR